MPGSSSIVKETDLTPYMDGLRTKEKVKAARLTEREDGTKAVEIKFFDKIPKIERQIMIIAIGENLLNLCADMDEEKDEENIPFLEFMDGAQIREWRDER